MVSAVRRVLRGESALSPDVSSKLAQAAMSGSVDPTHTLSVREFDILRMIARGHSHVDIGASLNLSAKTVANYHSQLRHKLGVSTDIELFQLACDCGVIDTPAKPTSES